MIAVFILGITGLKAIGEQLARLHYSGGGDWYNNPEVLPNLANFCNRNLGTDFSTEQKIIKPDNPKISQYPFIYMTGHGNVYFTEDERKNLRNWAENGGFLYIDDDYGMDKSIRKEIRKIFPGRKLIELPDNHPVYTSFFKFKKLPKIHKHDDKRPQALAITDDFGRITALYTFESNISDGWANASSHNDPLELREEALKFGANIIYYIMTGGN